MYSQRLVYECADTPTILYTPTWELLELKIFLILNQKKNQDYSIYFYCILMFISNKESIGLNTSLGCVRPMLKNLARTDLS